MSANLAGIVETLKRILTDEMNVRTPFDETTPLLEGGLDLDSVLIVELIGVIEDRFGIQFDDDDLRPSTFERLGSIAAVVERRLTER